MRGCRRDLQCLLTSKVFDAVVEEEEEEALVGVVEEKSWLEQARRDGTSVSVKQAWGRAKFKRTVHQP
jgi:hypothetical protein